MATAWARDRAQIFYLVCGLVGLAAALIGFSTTYLIPMARHSFSAPLMVHWHGLLCLSWLLLFIVQCLFIRRRGTLLHRRIGVIGLPIAIGILISGVMVARWTVTRDFAAMGQTAISSVLGTITTLTWFVAFVAAAIILRRRPDWHKRLMLLATVAVLWPAWFRWRHLLPFVPRPDISLAIAVANLPLLIAAIRDWRRYGEIHPVWKFVAPAFVAEQTIEVLVFDSAPWRAVAGEVYRLIA